MAKLFRRFYFAVLLTVLLTVVLVLIEYSSVSESDAQVVEASFLGAVRLVKDVLSQSEDRDAALRGLVDTFGYPVELRPIEDFSSFVAQRLADPNELVYFEDQLFSTFEGSGLVLGPLPQFEFPLTDGLTFIFIAIVWALLVFLLLRPIVVSSRRFESAARRIAQGELRARVPGDGGGVKGLASAFNDMADRTERLVRHQGELLQAVAHEFRTPLSRLRFAREVIATGSSEHIEVLDEMELDIDELHHLVDELLAFMRLDTSFPDRRETASIRELLAQVRGLDDEPRPRLEGALDSVVHAEPRLFVRAVDNIVRNARRFAHDEIRVTVENGQQHVEVRIDDDGPGIPHAMRDRVLMPFVREKSQSSGIGLGLAITDRIVRAHGGTLLIEDSPLGGCRVSTQWPSGSTTI
ncbi:MAG: ATP-binding protein [Myxococcota bacterium]